MSISRLYRAVAAATLSAGLLAGAIATGPSARAAGQATAKTVKPILLVVDTTVKASGLSQADVLKRSSALLPIKVIAPTYVPAGSQLFSVSVQRPFYQVTQGVATLIYGAMSSGITFEVDESPVPLNYAKATQTTVTINGWAGTVNDLGTVGTSHLIAITWSTTKGSYAITSNLGKSHLSTVTLLKVANSLK